ncbi:MAG: MBL fold metallo-hydrolase [Deltaproteobacteria bacterium]|nr:MBL fold metallo-hydrolase [Deltaproteobacteria bacterium]
MRVREPGKIAEGLWFLGEEETCVYLLEGERESIILSGGMSYIAPTVLRQFSDFGIDQDRIRRLLILHAHFDHVGIVPLLKKRIPDLEILASARAWELLGEDRVIQTINEFSRLVARARGRLGAYDEYELEWRPGVTGSTVKEGDRIELGGVSVRIFETPGHSSCSISAYVPELKALFASDGGGIPYRDTIISSGNSNYTRYQESLEKLRDLEVDYACADHYGYIKGEEARSFISDSIREAARRRADMERVYLQTRDIEKAVEEMAQAFQRENPDYIIAPEINRGIYRQMIRHIAGVIEGRDS